MNNYFKYEIFFKPFNPELVSGILWTLDISGIEENEQSLTVYSQKENLENQLESLMQNAVKSGLIEKYELVADEIENKNWNEEWEKTLNVIEITENIVIKPTFRNYDGGEGKLIVEIDPKMSFGTGEHETTRLMIELIEKHLRKGDKVLDIGSGTGALAIIAVKLGAESAVAVDTDEWCFVNGKENAEINKVADKIKFVHGDVNSVAESEFDLVLANINTHILLNYVKEIAAKVKLGGKLILSGILNTDEEKITGSYEKQNLKLIERTRKNEWIALVFEK